MTCASCVGRVEKALSRVDGVVTATVNLANETAVVTYRPNATDTVEMAAAVEKAGYTSRPRPQHEAQAPTAAGAPSGPGGRDQAASDPTAELDRRRDHEIASLKRRWQVALTTGLGLMAIMYDAYRPSMTSKT